jgi:chromosome partitioning protein
MDSLQSNLAIRNKTLSFYNMVQPNKNLHRHYLAHRKEEAIRILNNFIPFYSDIELITHTKESIFHQLRESKAIIYYHNLWLEICERMQWQALNNSKGIVVDIHKEQTVEFPTRISDVS